MTKNGSQRLPMILDPDLQGGRVQKSSTLSLAEMKARQTSKLRQLAETLIAAGFVSLGEQAEVLGLSRSTTWTILGANHKGSGLSAAIANRILAAPRLPRPVRSVLVEYVAEKAAGLYGGSIAQRRGFSERLAINAVKPAISGETDEQPRKWADQAVPKRDGGREQAISGSNNAKHYVSLNDNLRRPDGVAAYLRKNWKEGSLTNAKEVKCWSGIEPPPPPVRRGRPKSRMA